MHSKLSQKIKNNFDDYNRLWSAGEYLAAITYLGEIYLYLKDSKNTLEQQWLDKIYSLHLSEDLFVQILKEAENEKKALKKIVFNDNFLYEEIMLIFTKRIELFIVLTFLKECYHKKINLNLNSIDNEIRNLSCLKNNKPVFDQVIGKLNNYYKFSSELTRLLENFRKTKPDWVERS